MHFFAVNPGINTTATITSNTAVFFRVKEVAYCRDILVKRLARKSGRQKVAKRVSSI